MKALPTSVRPGRLNSVQIIRAVAALTVVAFHATVLLNSLSPNNHFLIWSNGAAGVDLFFVISGFIALFSGHSFARLRVGAYKFIEFRLIRLVPLYWAATTLKIVLILMSSRTLRQNSRLDLWNTVASFLFIPSRNAVGLVRPILIVGWTLSFEMLFYLIFAAALLTPIDYALFASLVLTMLSIISFFRTTAWPTVTILADPILVEFVFGILVARLFMNGRFPIKTSTAIGALTLGATFLFAASIPYPLKPVGRGLAAALILVGALALEEFTTRPLAKPLILLGEASYALYLVHGFVLPVVGFAVVRMHLNGLALVSTLIVAGLSSSVAAAIVVHLYFERPLTKFLRKLVRDPRVYADVAAAPSPIQDYSRRQGGGGFFAENARNPVAGRPISFLYRPGYWRPGNRTQDGAGGAGKAPK